MPVAFSRQSHRVSLASLAGVFGPPVAAWSFGAGIAPGSRVQLPGIAFFEGTLLCLAALVLAARAVSPDISPLAPRGSHSVSEI